MTDEIAALTALTEGDPTTARTLASRSGGRLGRALARFLETDHAEGVYAAPEAFEAFIDGGGNVPLYEAVSRELAAICEKARVQSLLDIGCGNGRALLPALRAYAPARVDLVEPSDALLTTAVGGLPEEVTSRTWPTTVQAFLEGLPTHEHWDLAQSTFALHTLPHEERSHVLELLRPHVDAVAVIDFDLPDHEHASPEHLRHLATTYERGLAEYDDDRDLVAQGFLMPVLTGQLRPGARRVTWEQSGERWAQQFTDAGYRDVDVRPVHDYWSAPAFVLRARSR
ncbi:class I SAM-dependent methyltransferase [Kineosporia succinea]|uniref:SAM-dependent methyltransferase n=1 Tax=Kineosporia succinea TaxID=84632 RepID=A0ABT9PD28_9ACTN|nr:class I SAM-dependent methyltransferase [Kineosporia succinea]MDP9830614.1 SAM-dependent methyltransferase [Kineosporia succinea]